MGAGGAARAVAFEACKRGGEVLILNRTYKKAKALADKIGCKAGRLEEVPSNYDLWINCCPDCILSPLEKTLCMDIVYFPRLTCFLERAALKGCEIIFGEEMFLNQAAKQTAFWMGE